MGVFEAFLGGSTAKLLSDPGRFMPNNLTFNPIFSKYPHIVIACIVKKN
jgi:hypothetical protein